MASQVLDPEKEFSISISEDNKSIIVIPVKVLTNSIYRVKISGITDFAGNPVPDATIEFKTPYSPMYCSLASLKTVIDTFGLPDNYLLEYIRQASKEADFIAGGTAVATGQAVPFEVEQFVRTKATYDCISRGFMDRAYSGAGAEYTLDVATFKDNLNAGAFKDLLGRLAKELQKWQDAIRGYYNEGRVKPKATRVGLKSSSNANVSFTTLDRIITDATRTPSQWS